MDWTRGFCTAAHSCHLDTVQAVAEVLQKTSLNGGINASETAHLCGALCESGLEFVEHTRVRGLRQNQLLPLQLLQVLHCLLQYVRLLELGMARLWERKRQNGVAKMSFNRIVDASVGSDGSSQN